MAGAPMLEYGAILGWLIGGFFFTQDCWSFTLGREQFPRRGVLISPYEGNCECPDTIARDAYFLGTICLIPGALCILQVENTYVSNSEI